MFFDFDFEEFGEPIDIIFEQYIGNQCVNRQKMSAPLFILKQQFENAVSEIYSQKGKQPLKIRFYKTNKIWSYFDNKFISVESSIEIKNWED